MRKLFKLIFFLTLTFCVLSTRPASAESPIQVAIFNPVQIVDEMDSIKGVRLNLIYGVNDNVSGIDLGLINKSEGDQKGIQLGIFNNTLDLSGIQLGLINKTDWLDGLQIGLINIATEENRSFFPIINFSF